MKAALPIIATIITFTANSPAAMILGDITFSGGATFDTSDFSTATQVISWDSVTVEQTSGEFLAAGIGNMTAVTFAPGWTINQGQPNFWTVGDFTFELNTTSVTQVPTFIIVSGQGTVSANGFDPTPFNINFSTQKASDSPRQTFSAATNSEAIPEPGTSCLLLAGILGLAARRRR